MYLSLPSAYDHFGKSFVIECFDEVFDKTKFDVKGESKQYFRFKSSAVKRTSFFNSYIV